MRRLVIDSATEACSVALFEDDRLLAGDFRMLGRGHAEQLVPMIAALPDRGRAGRITVSLGPGSFTGVRVGLAAARALALAWRAELTGYPTLGLVGAMAGERHAPQPLAVAMTGGHGEWFVQRFDDGAVPSAPVASLKPAEAVAHVEEELVAGSEAEALVAMRGAGIAVPLWPDARSFGLLHPGAVTDLVQPHYGRPPDARLPQSGS